MDQFHQTNHQIKLQIEENIRRSDERLAKCAIVQQNIEAIMQVDKIFKKVVSYLQTLVVSIGRMRLYT